MIVYIHTVVTETYPEVFAVEVEDGSDLDLVRGLCAAQVEHNGIPASWRKVSRGESYYEHEYDYTSVQSDAVYTEESK